VWSSLPWDDAVRLIYASQLSMERVVREVADCVGAGGTVIFPTETVYGIGCAPEDKSAVAAIFSAKGRSAAKPLALHIARVQQADQYVARLTACARSAMERLWPGPVAIVVERNPRRYEHAACGLATISLRCPDDELCRSILTATGPLAATSANRSGARAYDGTSADTSMLPDATLAVLAGPTARRRESTVVDCTGDAPVVLREGAVPAAQILEALGT
jgi:L-threonylcarbamoyladenylate synthase